MSLFKKKSNTEGIPEIPSLPDLPSFNKDIQKKPSIDLPPISGDARDINNQEVIKSAVDSSEKIGGDSGAAISPSETFSFPTISSQPTDSSVQKPVGLPPLPIFNQQSTKPLPVVPHYETQPTSFSGSLPVPPLRQDLSTIQEGITSPKLETSKQEEVFVKKDASESIFVRIDKFHSAKRDIEEVERDLKQITNVIEKINDIKLKEDEEITEINKTLEEIKNRINRVDLEVFNRI